MWANFHTHSHYCDGKSKFNEYLKKGGMISLGFSSHAPLPFVRPWCMKPENFKQYLKDLEELKKTSPIEIYKGLEIDFIPGMISPLQFAEQLDYTIGSIHFVEKLSNGMPWEIDGSHMLFLQGLAEIFNGRARDAVIRYFELTREMIRTSRPTIIGHMDKIKIQNINNKLFLETSTWYRSEILKTLDTIEEAGAIIEVNTRGLYHKRLSNPYPSYWILELIYQKNIPIMLSSDAHHADDIHGQFNEAALTLRRIGFRKLCVLHEGHWKQFNFDTNGFVGA